LGLRAARFFTTKVPKPGIEKRLSLRMPRASWSKTASTTSAT